MHPPLALTRSRLLLSNRRPLTNAIKGSFLTFSTASESSAASIASRFLDRFQSQGPTTRTQLLDRNQLQLLSLTLNRPQLHPGLSIENQSPPDGTPIPPGYHLGYFTPTFLEKQLGLDGTDVSYNPENPFTRRMWAGGEITWQPNLLRVGQEVRETTIVLTAEPKVIRKTGEEMIVVAIRKTFENDHGLAVTDNRSWVFRKALPPPSPNSETPTYPTPPSPPVYPETQAGQERIRYYCQSPAALFRFSALTFNTHKIHFSLPWCQNVEGHRNVVVHGPLNLINLLDLWRDVRNEGETSTPAKIAYRATWPLYADEEYRASLEPEEGKKTNVVIHAGDGAIAMKADITAL